MNHVLTVSRDSAVSRLLVAALERTGRVQLVDGDAASAAWAEADSIVHCAERDVLDDDLALARRHNVEPVARLIEVLRAHPALRLTYVSSAWVAGDKRGLFTEFDHDCGQRFHNAYERSKYEAEGLLRASDVRSRVLIVRRSAILDAGEEPLGPLLAALGKRRPILVAGDPRAEVDAVAAEEFAASVAAASSDPAALGKTLHLVAGPARRRTFRSIVNAARRGPVWFVPPALAPLARLVAALTAGLVRAFPPRGAQPYVRHRCAFDDFQARRILAHEP